MATIFSHGLVAAALGTAFPAPRPARFWFYGISCAMAPDIDVIGFAVGIKYEDVLGHRGLTHSIAFALALSAIATVLLRALEPRQGAAKLWLFLFLATGSHGLLDALTNGGLGVAFFAPFVNTRYFFPAQPIEVAPIGAAFFSGAGLEVLKSEAIWLWLPALGFVIVAASLRRIVSKCAASRAT